MSGDLGPATVLRLEDNPGIALASAAATLRAGGVVVFPTDTVYGLLAGTDRATAYRRIYDLKQRPAGEPLALLVVRAGALAQAVTEQLRPFPGDRQRFERGELTLVLGPQLLPAGALPAGVQRTQPGDVGVRCPDFEPLQQLLAAGGGLLWASSANASGEPPAATAVEVQRWLSSLTQPPELSVLTSATLSGRPSTVVRLTDEGLTRIHR